MAASNTSDGQVQPAGFDYAEIIVVRHGERKTEKDADGKILEHLNLGLTDKGISDSEAVAERLSREPKISAVYSSDLKRAVETAEIVAASCGGLEVIQDSGLREKRYGVLPGIVALEAATHPEGSEESIKEINQRCASCLQRIGDNHRGERIVVVTHGGVMRAFYKRVNPPHERTPRVWSSSVSVLHLSDGDEWKIIVWGNASHLESGTGGVDTSGTH
ncbi:Phosphoglycerate mutase-like protein 4 [Heracleum sosnowskyi]|uniref:Phosphoglycerate mutase-like protein 4 n=1 Tax=Heracleum sosnowskyi TaxID=360622 RepID=A0AAD8HC54_9APIA|nr:Phosphoglycerate mutase-like protein 4 [Heracleum sosnowskyi]